MPDPQAGQGEIRVKLAASRSGGYELPAILAREAAAGSVVVRMH
jgi:hypothetical protein